MVPAAHPSIRPATPDDVQALAALKLDTFRETFLEAGFAIPYPPADLALFEAASYAPKVIAREIADPAHATWVADGPDGLCGYAHVGPCKLPHPDVEEGAGELYQIYVRRGAQGTGLGRRLLGRALDHLTGSRPGPIWLGVWSGNLKAQALYLAHGFRKAGEYAFPVGAWLDQEYIFRRD